MKHKIIRKQYTSDDCFICGEKNPYGLQMRFFETEDGKTVAHFIARNEHQSYPGRLHGGIIAAITDETIGRALLFYEPDAFGVTVELNIKYKKPVPLNEKLLVVGEVTRNTRLLFEGRAQILLPNGDVAAECTAKYMKMTLKNISDVELPLYYRKEAEDLQEIDF